MLSAGPDICLFTSCNIFQGSNQTKNSYYNARLLKAGMRFSSFLKRMQVTKFKLKFLFFDAKFEI